MDINMENMIEDLKKPEALSNDYLEACKDWLELILSGHHMELAGDERIIVFHLYNVSSSFPECSPSVPQYVPRISPECSPNVP
jgi:hypothetical protein